MACSCRSPNLLRKFLSGLLHVTFTTQLTAYTNADWAGYLLLDDNLLSWSATRHVTLLRSSAEVEYHGVANVVVETAWIRNLLH
ncbi:ribonuclease H-like domain-containing protein [Tanacetum coccineum]|uniref:Ribonuclease H-like domain-containing protein n=1 Tax=Tanacetum coccineum TaxID=301880 RepID=A0ABQ5CWI0_9ASTR